jgi:hypothetical protein
MSRHEADRRGVDEIIHNRRLQIAAYDKQLSGLGAIPEGIGRGIILEARSELSRAQGIDKRFVRRQEKARRRQPVTIARGVAVRII